MLEKAFEFQKKNTFLILLGIAVLGIILRLAFLNRTDITGDEAFYGMFAFKIAHTLLSSLLLVIPAVLAVAVFSYFAFVKKNWKITAILLSAVLIAKFAFKIPYIFYSPEFFIILQSLGIALTGLKPNIVGELISTFSTLGIAVCAFFICRKIFDERTGIIAFALLMLSPFGIFISASSFRDSLGMFLGTLSLALLAESARQKKLLPLAGLALALGLSTRETIFAFIPVFAILAWAWRKEILSKECRKEALVCSAVILFAIAYNLPVIAGNSGITQAYIQKYGSQVNDLSEQVHYSSFIADGIGGTARTPSSLFYLKLAWLFYTPLLLVFTLGGAFLILKKRNPAQLAILLLFLVFLIYFSAILSIQRTNYLAEIEFPMLAISALALAELGKRKRLWIIAAFLLAAFAVQSVIVIQQHEFKGFSQALQKIPEGKTIYSSIGTDVPEYYSGIYVFDTEVNNPFFKKFFPPNPERQKEFELKKSLLLTDNKKYSSAQIDYSITSKKIGELGFNERDFRLCEELKSGKDTAFWLFANKRNSCP